jgi:nicotinate-nucleotide adenylyltransferase
MRKSTLTPPNLMDSPRWGGMKIGLLGGSFNPAHKGHRHIARMAMAEYDLDFVWWLVTPQNPLKDKAHMATYDVRFQSVQSIIAGHPHMMATHIEQKLGTNYTYETVKGLMKSYPKTDFVFICGMDNAHIFHRWDRWRTLTRLMPIVFIARPPAGSLIQNCPVRMLGKGAKVSFLHTSKMLDISSTQIRKSFKNS